MFGLGTVILTLATLQLGKNSNKGSSDKVVVKHVIPGRIRVASERLKRIEVGEVLMEQLEKVDGIDTITINTTTGSLLLNYNIEKLEEEILIMALKTLIEEKKEPSKANSDIFNELKLVRDSVDHALMEKTNGKLDLKGAIPAVLIAVALKKLITTKTLGTPSSLTLLYWAYNQINKEEKVGK